ncbi:MAG: MBL fold metallo-hydrolase [Candidatus Pacebacteria bacterium]|nr:MBL fold metallo-hydrolase [Candidatus Paceibacterota bacterium]
MKTTLYWLVGIVLVLVLLFYAFNSYIYNEKQGDTGTPDNTSMQVIPISHATAILQWGDLAIYTDPTGGAEAFAGQPAPDLILLTDIHGDHLSTSTIDAVMGNATIIAPQAVADLLPETLASRTQILGNGERTTELDFDILALPMYNLPESPDSRHTKGRGNGYVIEKEGLRVYVAGDTAGIPEMRALTNIDIAFIPMNLPFTMGVEEAADAVLAFKPAQVYPYHYRGQDGLSDINRFKELVNAGDPDIEVVLLDWYPE